METDKNLKNLIYHEGKSPLRSGFFITFEGIDGSGKSVQAKLLVQNLNKTGFYAFQVRDPGGSIIAEKIRSILLDREHHTLNPLSELLLYEAARSQLVSEIILPRLEKGEIVVCDRFNDSSIAYQGYGRKIPLEVVQRLNYLSCRGISPHRTYLLDISTETSVHRRQLAGFSDDRMENQNHSFHQDVRCGYLETYKKEPERIVLIQGERPIEILEQEILKDAITYIQQLKKMNHLTRRK